MPLYVGKMVRCAYEWPSIGSHARQHFVINAGACIKHEQQRGDVETINE